MDVGEARPAHRIDVTVATGFECAPAEHAINAARNSAKYSMFNFEVLALLGQMMC